MPDQKVIGPAVVCSGFIKKDNKFLMVFCPRFKVWRVPGGRVEFTETLEQTFLREMKEEIGLDLTEPKFIGWGRDNQYHVRDQHETSRLLMFFYVKINQEPIVDPDEAEEFKWVTIQEMRDEKNKEGALTDFLNKNPNINFE